jgi:lipopolysaccharide export system permease protein
MLRLYLSRLFLQRVLGALLALAAILQLLDLLDQAGTILGKAGLSGMAIYVGYRLPGLVTAMLPLAVLLGALLTFMRLSGSQEMTAIQSAGLGSWQVLARLLPACALICVAAFVLQAELAPRSERGFADWWARIDPPGPQDEKPGRLWLRAHGDVAAIDDVSLDGKRLGGVLIIQRSAEGDLVTSLQAKSAQFTSGHWQLADVRLARNGRSQTEAAATTPWPHGPPPANMIALARPVESETLGHLVASLHGTWLSGRGTHFTWTELNGLAAFVLSPLLMLMLAAPVLIVLPRSTAGRVQFAVRLTLGLAYLAAAGLLEALGGAGVLPPVIAGWAAFLTFGIYAAFGVSAAA